NRFGVALDGSRPYSFVRLLGGFSRAVKIGLIREIILAIAPIDIVADRGQRVVRYARRVSAHISNESDGTLVAQLDALVELLRNLHGARGRVIQFARSLLLQTRGDEWRSGAAANLLALDFADDKGRFLAGSDDLIGQRLQQPGCLVV